VDDDDIARDIAPLRSPNPEPSTDAGHREEWKERLIPLRELITLPSFCNSTILAALERKIR